MSIYNDHIGGLLNVLENIPVQEVIDPGVITGQPGVWFPQGR
ncbi:MAG: hypothetical protein ACOX1X_02495 [Dethiobacteria bacterium]